MKQTGILLPVFSLPSAWGVGDLGQAAYDWIDLLAEYHIAIWQILPINPVGYGNSPYQPYSSCAGDEIFISLERLYEEGLLKTLPGEAGGKSGLESSTHPGFSDKKVDYDRVRAVKEPYLREAFRDFEVQSEPASGWTQFCAQPWVRQYGVFRALKKNNNGVCWDQWPLEQKYWPEAESGKSSSPTLGGGGGSLDLQPLEQEIQYQIFLQYEFYCQWMEVKAYANEKKVSIMGDVPFYVGVDSVDVWAGKKNFLLDAEGKPAFIAGVPPDYFSATGQRWGNPIYDWDYIRETGYEFWVDRIGYSQKLFDIIRIDHFRAFDTYWKIPASCPTAEEGDWIEAPGYEVLDTIMDRIPEVCLVAEDLGELRPEAVVLKEHYHLKGMKILQFTIETKGKYGVDAFPVGGSAHQSGAEGGTENLIIYTGTHDNATTREWYESLSLASRRKVRKWLKRSGFTEGSVVERLIRYTLASEAEYAVIPAYDFLEEGASSRINTPGTVGSPNWEWQLAGNREQSMQRMRQAMSKYKKCIGERCSTVGPPDIDEN